MKFNRVEAESRALEKYRNEKKKYTTVCIETPVWRDLSLYKVAHDCKSLSSAVAELLEKAKFGL